MTNEAVHNQRDWKSVPGSLSSIRAVSSDIMKKLEPLGFSNGETFDIRLCVEEAVSNAVKYGCKDNSRSSFDYFLDIRDDAVEIGVRCGAGGFDPAAVADPTSSPNVEKGSGRGIFLIRKLMDRVTFEEGGAAVRMLKYRKKA